MSESEDRMESRQREVLARLDNNLRENLLDLLYRLERLEHAHGLAPHERMTRLRPLATSEDIDATMKEITTRVKVLEDLSGE